MTGFHIALGILVNRMAALRGWNKIFLQPSWIVGLFPILRAAFFVFHHWLQCCKKEGKKRSGSSYTASNFSRQITWVKCHLKRWFSWDQMLRKSCLHFKCMFLQSGEFVLSAFVKEYLRILDFWWGAYTWKWWRVLTPNNTWMKSMENSYVKLRHFPCDADTHNMTSQHAHAVQPMA